MQENDLLLMSLVIFLPTAFALALVFFPKGKDEAVRWWSLCGTALTLGISLSMFLEFRKEISESHGSANSPVESVRKEARRHAQLDKRVADEDRADVAKEARKSSDWVSRNPWIAPFHIEYFVGTDGISMALVLLTTVVCFLAMIASWSITKFVKGYCILFLLLETGMLGVFLSLDFFLFFIFWEVMLLPMYFLIGIWGGPRREYAALKFFLYTLFGGVLMLIAMFAFYFTDLQDFKTNDPVKLTDDQIAAVRDKKSDKPVHSFDLILLARAGQEAARIIEEKPGNALEKATDAHDRETDPTKKEAYARKIERLKQGFFTKPYQITMFLLLFVGFAIKLPMVPFHTWLPDAHVEAPTPISMILAGVLLKMGGYGILRIAYPICPAAAKELATMLAALGLVSLVYGAFAAMAQTDFKKLVAYSSVSHMGYVLLGIAVWPAEKSDLWAWGMNGAMYQMIGHGISSAGMFFMVGVVYERAHHRNLDNFRGICEPMPLYSGLSAVVFFAALGLPGLCGFVGEFMVVLSTWNFKPAFAVIAALAVVITAAYILWCIQRVFLGTNPACKDYADITLRELACAVPLVVLAVLFGVMPRLVFDWMEPSVTGLVDTLYALSAATK